MKPAFLTWSSSWHDKDIAGGEWDCFHVQIKGYKGFAE